MARLRFFPLASRLSMPRCLEAGWLWVALQSFRFAARVASPHLLRSLLAGLLNWEAINWEAINWEAINWEAINWEIMLCPRPQRGKEANRKAARGVPSSMPALHC